MEREIKQGPKLDNCSTWGEPPCDLVIETHRSTAMAVIVPATKNFNYKPYSRIENKSESFQNLLKYVACFLQNENMSK